MSNSESITHSEKFALLIPWGDGTSTFLVEQHPTELECGLPKYIPVLFESYQQAFDHRQMLYRDKAENVEIINYDKWQQNCDNEEESAE